MAKPIKGLELHYSMIQFLTIIIINIYIYIYEGNTRRKQMGYAQFFLTSHWPRT